MASEGRLFRNAYEALDRLAPVAPDFGSLGTIKLTIAEPVTKHRSWMMTAATAVVIVVLALVPVLLLGQGGSPPGSGQTAPTTSIAAGVATTSICGDTTTTMPPTEAPPVGPLPTTTSTVGEGVPTTDPSVGTSTSIACPDITAPTDTTVPPGPTTTTIEPTDETYSPYTLDEAQAFLIEFLTHMRDGSYDIAAVMYGSYYDRLIDWNPTVDPGDRTALLAAACDQPLLCDLLVREVVAREVSGNIFTFHLSLETGDGEQYVWQDQDGGTQTVWEFRVVEEEGLLKSNSLPLYPSALGR